MAVTTDIRFKRMQGKYQALEVAQDELFDKVDGFEAALLGLTEMVSENQRQIVELHQKIDTLMRHFDVPYKPPAGFIKE